MRKLMLILLFSFIAASLAQAQATIQIATEVDAAGKAINWTELTVTWETTDLTEAEVPDHQAIDRDREQIWYVPLTDTTWRRFSFTRAIVGLYFIRYSLDGAIFSVPSSCYIVAPAQPRHGG